MSNIFIEMPASVVLPVQGTKESAAVAYEHEMTVTVDGQPSMHFVCTPQYPDELIMGRMFTDGMIDGIDDIADITISGNGLEAAVTLRKNHAGRTDRKRGNTNPVKWEPSWFEGILKRMEEGEPVFLETHAVHACYLAGKDEVICCREDIGRHNAMDKVVGYALKNGIDLSECFLFTTGRMPSDMVKKAVNAGVSLLASKTFPTQSGVELAKKENLTMVTVRRDGTFLLWTGKE